MSTAKAGLTFTHTVPLRFSDTDALGHVNNSRYVTYLEDSRIAFLMRIVGDDAPFTPGLILAHTEIDYIRPVMLSVEPLQVTMWISHIGTKSFTIDYEIHHQGELMASAKTIIVAYDYATQQSQVLTAAQKSALGSYLRSS